MSKSKHIKEIKISNSLIGIACLLLIMALSACKGTNEQTNTAIEAIESRIEQQAQDNFVPDSTLIKNKANNILRILQNEDWRTLATHAHPKEGIRFSPYADVNSTNLVFKKEDLSKINSTDIYMWGAYDGSGSPIRRTLPQYYSEFLYDVDYLAKANTIYNQHQQYGNSYNTIEKMYPGSLNVEYYIPNLDPKMRGFDWRALRLVFTQYEKKWYLTAIIHSSYTS